ncbi:GDSL-type esterase/lipase family protein [Niallia taxi]|uniref:GDSL-type esterase/lipase family protein n=1 Tax=Niallia taxi TaxID=2499688 RepID=UPI003F5EF051
MKPKLIILLVLSFLLTIIVFFGNFQMEKEEAGNYLKAATTTTNANLLNNEDDAIKERINWITSGLSKKDIKNPNELVTEAEFLILLYKAYNKTPSVTDTSKFWAEDYYKSGLDYGYPLWEAKKRDQPITIKHLGALIAAVQGDKINEIDSVPYLKQNQFFIFKDQQKNITRKESIEFINRLVENGFYLLQTPKEDISQEVIVALGDSISMGWGIKNNVEMPKYGFPNLISSMNNKFHTFNLSSRGLRTVQLIEKLKKPTYKNKLSDANYITVYMGSSDLLHVAEGYLRQVKAQNGASPSKDIEKEVVALINEINKNMDTIINQIRQDSSVPIYLYSIYNPIPKGTTGNSYGNTVMEAINKHYKDIAKNEKNVILIDSFNAFKGKESTYIINGDVHPTLEGQRLMAKMALEKIEEVK